MDDNLMSEIAQSVDDGEVRSTIVDAEIRTSWLVTQYHIPASALNLFGGKLLVDLQEYSLTMSRTFMSI